MWLRFITLQEDFPGNLRNTSTEGRAFWGAFLPASAGVKDEPRKLGWTFTGIPQGIDTLVKTSHRIEELSASFCTVPSLVTPPLSQRSF